MRRARKSKQKIPLPDPIKNHAIYLVHLQLIKEARERRAAGRYTDALVEDTLHPPMSWTTDAIVAYIGRRKRWEFEDVVLGVGL